MWRELRVKEYSGQDTVRKSHANDELRLCIRPIKVEVQPTTFSCAVKEKKTGG